MRKHRFRIWARSALVMKPAPLGWSRLACGPIAGSGRLAYQTLLDSFLDFLDLDFGEAANLEQVLAVLRMNSLLQ
jgi:hypothetical protein